LLLGGTKPGAGENVRPKKGTATTKGTRQLAEGKTEKKEIPKRIVFGH